MDNKNNQIRVNIGPFMGKINAYVFKFLEKSITGKLVDYNSDYLTIELKSGGVIVAHIDSLVSIWSIREKREAA
jgi:uncharacterized protein YqkB